MIRTGSASDPSSCGAGKVNQLAGARGSERRHANRMPAPQGRVRHAGCPSNGSGYFVVIRITPRQSRGGLR